MNWPDSVIEFGILGLAAWRVFQLEAFDTILDWPRRKLLRLAQDWDETQDLPDDYRLNYAIFITCPYCAGFWIALAWWGAFQVSEHWTMVFASLWALAAMPVAGHKLLARDEDK